MSLMALPSWVRPWGSPTKLGNGFLDLFLTDTLEGWKKFLKIGNALVVLLKSGRSHLYVVLDSDELIR